MRQLCLRCATLLVVFITNPCVQKWSQLLAMQEEVALACAKDPARLQGSFERLRQVWTSSTSITLNQ
jgi:hypothetical protein